MLYNFNQRNSNYKLLKKNVKGNLNFILLFLKPVTHFVRENEKFVCSLGIKVG